MERFKDEIVVNDILGNTDELQQMLLKAFQEADPDNCGMLSQRQVRAARGAALCPRATARRAAPPLPGQPCAGKSQAHCLCPLDHRPPHAKP